MRKILNIDGRALTVGLEGQCVGVNLVWLDNKGQSNEEPIFYARYGTRAAALLVYENPVGALQERLAECDALFEAALQDYKALEDQGNPAPLDGEKTLCVRTMDIDGEPLRVDLSWQGCEWCVSTDWVWADADGQVDEEPLTYERYCTRKEAMHAYENPDVGTLRSRLAECKGN